MFRCLLRNVAVNEFNKHFCKTSLDYTDFKGKVLENKLLKNDLQSEIHLFIIQIDWELKKECL